MKKPLATLFIICALVVSLFFIERRMHASQEFATIPNVSEEIKSRLSPEAYDVMYNQGTERPFSSPLDYETRKGTYVSADTGLPLFRSEDKYDSGTGWPSFTKPISSDAVVLHEDTSLFPSRVEVVTKDTGAHLGHIFEDGPAPLGKRYCMNGVALRFIPDDPNGMPAATTSVPVK